MDIHEFIHRLHEAKREAGNRPVEVTFETRRLQPKGWVEIKFVAAPGVLNEPEKPKIIISHPI